MRELRDWVRLPTDWIIKDQGLQKLRWGSGGKGANHTAALMALTAIAHRADQQSGIAHATYNQLCSATTLSRAKLACGLDVLQELELISRDPDGRSSYQLMGWNRERGWAKFPAKSMYRGETIAAFRDFSLRKIPELDSLKLLFLFVAFRSQKSNRAHIGYEKIQQYSGLEGSRIKTGCALLTVHQLVHAEYVPRADNQPGGANAYRILGIDPYNHLGTRGRSTVERIPTVSTDTNYAPYLNNAIQPSN